MTYIETHLIWMQEKGLRVQDFDSVAPIPNVPSDLPEELQLWFDLRVPNRASAFEPLGYGGHDGDWLTPDWEQNEYWFLEPQEFDDARARGRFPLKPVGLASFIHGGIVVESAGDRLGWVFANTYSNPETGGPLATSLSQLLYAVRRLTDVGLLQPWEEGVRFGAQPPRDTPRSLISYECVSDGVGDLYDSEVDGPPLAASIRHLLPDFEFVMTLGEPGRSE